MLQPSLEDQAHRLTVSAVVVVLRIHIATVEVHVVSVIAIVVST